MPSVMPQVDFAQSVFGKTLSELSFDDLVDFFQEAKSESNTLEFKSFPTAHSNFQEGFKGVTKCICGLLNSEGGIVVWGAPIGIVDNKTNEKSFVGPLTPIPDYFEKDRLINKLSDLISPLPTGINVVNLQSHEKKHIYIFQIQPSHYKPHQYQNIYYIRLDGQTKPAPHYFIEALFRQITFPNIEGYLKFNLADFHPQSVYRISISILLYNFSELHNEENVVYRLFTYPGKILTQQHTREPNSYFGKEDLLHFGTPKIDDQQVIVSADELEECDYEVNLVLTVAGKKSPVKTSSYTLNLKNIDQDNPTSTNTLVIKMEENMLISEKKKQLGTTRETTLKSILGRIP